MSGDVQPRKRKDKKKKKDDLGVEEPRGTAAALGEGDVFMHSQSEHGTGGHWCAKIIFFSLLAVLITLVGLIILENRGLTELEANSVESQYSNILEGWIEDSPDDDHHDEHTLELKHHDEDDEEHGNEIEGDDDNDEHDDDEHDGDEENEGEDDHDGDENDDEQENEDENDDEQETDDENDDELEKDDDDDTEQAENDSQEADNDEDENQASEELNTAEDDEDDDEHGDEEEPANIEIETIEKEVTDDATSVEEQANDDDDNSQEVSKEEESPIEEDISMEDDDVEFLEPDELDELPIVETITAPKGKPLAEVGETTSEKPQDTLADEEEYERQQEALRKEKEEASQGMWLKLTVGGALLVATHAVLRRATAPRETDNDEEPDSSREETPLSDRRMTLITEPVPPPSEDGGNSIEDEWPGEPADAFWSETLDQAERDLRQSVTNLEGEWSAATERASAAELRSSARARYIAARALDIGAEAKKDNQLLSRAIAAYIELLKMNERLSDEKLLEVTNRTLDRIKFRGTYLSAEPIYKMLIRRFPDNPNYRNNLTVSLLMANRADLAEDVLKETLKLWPNDRFALAHLGFVLKTLHNRLEEAVNLFTKALDGDSGPANEPRFYYHLGDALLLLGRFSEANEVHKRGAALRHFLSPNQRSLYNVERLKSKPWWDVEQTPYSRLARALEKSWKEILKEGEAAKASYEKEKEGLKERGEWSQLDLFVRGREVPNRCAKAPVTCGIVRSEVGASGCRRGQVKFSAMEAGTHVRPHVGPTNCRLRMHLGLSNTKYTYIRVDQETRQWQTGKVLMFDDSFEHEVWHNGTGARLVLIVDVWHPDLTPAERRQLPAI